jgi:hypothetical protein
MKFLEEKKGGLVPKICGRLRGRGAALVTSLASRDRVGRPARDLRAERRLGWLEEAHRARRWVPAMRRVNCHCCGVTVEASVGVSKPTLHEVKRSRSRRRGRRRSRPRRASRRAAGFGGVRVATNAPRGGKTEERSDVPRLLLAHEPRRRQFPETASAKVSELVPLRGMSIKALLEARLVLVSSRGLLAKSPPTRSSALA